MFQQTGFRIVLPCICLALLVSCARTSVSSRGSLPGIGTMNGVVVQVDDCEGSSVLRKDPELRREIVHSVVRALADRGIPAGRSRSELGGRASHLLVLTPRDRPRPVNRSGPIAVEPSETVHVHTGPLLDAGASLHRIWDDGTADFLLEIAPFSGHLTSAERVLGAAIAPSQQQLRDAYVEPFVDVAVTACEWK